MGGLRGTKGNLAVGLDPCLLNFSHNWTPRMLGENERSDGI